MEIKNGIVTRLDGIKIIQHLIPISNTLARPQYPMIPEYITIHNTGNPGASALANSMYVDNVDTYKSWHFTVGSNEVYQELPITESAWHAGDGKTGTGNRKSIGIEIAEVDGAEGTAIRFVAQLVNATKIKIENIVPHQRWSGKYCPRLILPHWDKFIENIQKEMESDNMTVQEAEKIIQEKAGLDNNTMQYLRFYRFSDALLIKLAIAMNKLNQA
ncbi:MAG: N-acetylmuramoyl-L-alanine amidase [Tissierellia bacterium]|nr:N-acetylmuramoyl-L-alanine amidase [Tissierellia bacterium]MDD4781175.1 N-acetylmuramoyl-L-alanine amidase [Tissierellia bacterium]